MERITQAGNCPTIADLLPIIASMAAEIHALREELKRLTPSVNINNSVVSVNYNSPNATATNTITNTNNTNSPFMSEVKESYNETIKDNQIAIGENNAVNRETNIKDNQVAIGNEVNGSNNGLATRIHNQANGNNNTIAEQNGTNNQIAADGGNATLNTQPSESRRAAERPAP